MSLGRVDDCSCSYSEDGNKVHMVLMYAIIVFVIFIIHIRRSLGS